MSVTKQPRWRDRDFSVLPSLVSLSEELQRLRVAKQWSKEELAERSKTAVRTIYRLESLRSISLPADTTIDALSAALGADTTKWLRLLRAAKVELRKRGGIDQLEDV